MKGIAACIPTGILHDASGVYLIVPNTVQAAIITPTYQSVLDIVVNFPRCSLAGLKVIHSRIQCKSDTSFQRHGKRSPTASIYTPKNENILPSGFEHSIASYPGFLPIQVSPLRRSVAARDAGYQPIIPLPNPTVH